MKFVHRWIYSTRKKNLCVSGFPSSGFIYFISKIVRFSFRWWWWWWFDLRERLIVRNWSFPEFTMWCSFPETWFAGANFELMSRKCSFPIQPTIVHCSDVIFIIRWYTTWECWTKNENNENENRIDQYGTHSCYRVWTSTCQSIVRMKKNSEWSNGSLSCARSLVLSFARLVSTERRSWLTLNSNSEKQWKQFSALLSASIPSDNSFENGLFLFKYSNLIRAKLLSYPEMGTQACSILYYIIIIIIIKYSVTFISYH